jgi:hypothetical protein
MSPHPSDKKTRGMDGHSHGQIHSISATGTTGKISFSVILSQRKVNQPAPSMRHLVHSDWGFLRCTVARPHGLRSCARPPPIRPSPNNPGSGGRRSLTGQGHFVRVLFRPASRSGRSDHGADSLMMRRMMRDVHASTRLDSVRWLRFHLSDIQYSTHDYDPASYGVHTVVSYICTYYWT